MDINSLDKKLIHFFRMVSVPLARWGLFIIFFWFGLLKVLGLSPASGLMQRLFENTIPWMPFATFMILFGLFEMLIGILFLIKGTERIVIPLLFLHMIIVSMPLFILPEETWSGFLVPTMEGQYIIKNIALIACAFGIAAHLHPLPRQ
jgi:uncharacterized membrane protein YkgB